VNLRAGVVPRQGVYPVGRWVLCFLQETITRKKGASPGENNIHYVEFENLHNGQVGSETPSHLGKMKKTDLQRHPRELLVRFQGEEPLREVLKIIIKWRKKNGERAAHHRRREGKNWRGQQCSAEEGDSHKSRRAGSPPDRHTRENGKNGGGTRGGEGWGGGAGTSSTQKK